MSLYNRTFEMPKCRAAFCNKIRQVEGGCSDIFQHTCTKNEYKKKRNCRLMLHNETAIITALCTSHILCWQRAGVPPGSVLPHSSSVASTSVSEVIATRDAAVCSRPRKL